MKTNPIIVVNALMGSKGHQIARLIASCSNVRWYDHHWNGANPFARNYARFVDSVKNSTLTSSRYQLKHQSKSPVRKLFGTFFRIAMRFK